MCYKKEDKNIIINGCAWWPSGQRDGFFCTLTRQLAGGLNPPFSGLSLESDGHVEQGQLHYGCLEMGVSQGVLMAQVIDAHIKKENDRFNEVI